MSFGTYLKTEIYFSHETYSTLYEVEEKIEEVKREINDAKSELKQLAVITEPNKFIDYDKSEYSNLFDYVSNRADYLCESIESNSKDLYKLNLLKENWDNCHIKDGEYKGLARGIPEGQFDVSYLDGDYIETDTQKEREKSEKE